LFKLKVTSLSTPKETETESKEKQTQILSEIRQALIIEEKLRIPVCLWIQDCQESQTNLNESYLQNLTIQDHVKQLVIFWKTFLDKYEQITFIWNLFQTQGCTMKSKNVLKMLQPIFVEDSGSEYQFNGDEYSTLVEPVFTRIENLILREQASCPQAPDRFIPLRRQPLNR